MTASGVTPGRMLKRVPVNRPAKFSRLSAITSRQEYLWRERAELNRVLAENSHLMLARTGIAAAKHRAAFEKSYFTF